LPQIFSPAPKGKVKIVLATNIAETSITIDDCVLVIDTGRMKQLNYQAEKRITALEAVWVSRANAMQRRGRAGRVRPGTCFHLFTQHRFEHCLASQQVSKSVKKRKHGL
jgi:ATP-dependent RNA helicase DHX57